MIRVKRAYEPAARQDGKRFLVDRVWPRGIKKDELQIEGWLKEVAPSTELRKWFGHDPERWKEFQQRYRHELGAHPESVSSLLDAAGSGNVTLVYGARDTQHNQAIVLKGFLEEKLASESRPHAR
ncbi:MAG: DUF488 domain-containing protein [Chloroflexi bacterium]|nr:DUF488 domain-containing protein [Chloroflexota bacterium]